LEAVRRRAVSLVATGQTQAAVAKKLSVPIPTVARGLARHRADGDAGLDAQPTPGRPQLLSDAQDAPGQPWLAPKPTEHVDGIHDFVIDLKPPSDGTIKIYAPVAPDGPYGNGPTTHLLYASGEVCVAPGKEPRDYDKAEAVARYGAQCYSDYVTTGTFSDNGAKVRVRRLDPQLTSRRIARRNPLPARPRGDCACENDGEEALLNSLARHSTHQENDRLAAHEAAHRDAPQHPGAAQI